MAEMENNDESFVAFEEFVAIDEQSNVEENFEEYDWENIEQNYKNSDFGKIVVVQIKPGKRRGGTHYVTEDNFFSETRHKVRSFI